MVGTTARIEGTTATAEETTSKEGMTEEEGTTAMIEETTAIAMGTIVEGEVDYRRAHIKFTTSNWPHFAPMLSHGKTLDVRWYRVGSD